MPNPFLHARSVVLTLCTLLLAFLLPAGPALAQTWAPETGGAPPRDVEAPADALDDLALYVRWHYEVLERSGRDAPAVEVQTPQSGAPDARP